MSIAGLHDLQEFNRGLFDFLIATDDSGRQEASKAASAATAREGDASQDQTASSSHQVGGQEAAGEAAEDQEEAAADHAWAAPVANAELQQVMVDWVILTAGRDALQSKTGSGRLNALDSTGGCLSGRIADQTTSLQCIA